MNNETVFAQIQLNGSDNISNSWSSPVNLGLSSPLSIREPYYKRENNYMYMYVGVGGGNAVELRAKQADKADLSYELHTKASSSYATRVRIGPSSEIDKQDGIVDNFIWVYPAGQANVSAGQRTLPSVSIHYNSIIGTESSDNQRPSISGFNIQLLSGTTLSGAGTISGVRLYEIPRLTLKRGSTTSSKNRGYGTALPTTADPGEVFFLIAE